MSKYPAEWASKPLGKIYPKIVVGYVGNVNDHYCSSEEGVPFYRTLNIRDGFFRHSEHPYVTQAFNEKNKKSQIQNNDILIARVGANLGMVCKAEGIDGLANMANAIIIKTNSVTSANADFYTSFLLSPMGKNQIFSGAAGGAQGVFNTKLTQEIIVPVPPLPEQRKIAKILSAWDKAITTTEKLIETSKQQKKALMQQLLTGKKRLVNPDTGKAFEREWVEEEIGNLLKEVKRPVKWDDNEDYHLLSVKRRSEGIVLREVLNGHKILTKKMNLAKEGDFLISKMQVVHGASGLVTSEFDNCHISGSYISLVPKSSDSLDIEFFSWLSKQKKMYHQTFLCSYGVHIEKMTFNFKLYLKEKVSLPNNISEQQKIASVLTAADKEIEVLEAKLGHFKQEKKALMQQLLTGKRRVKIDEVEAA